MASPTAIAAYVALFALTGFLFLFSVKTLKLRITIQDRMLNKSNTIESGDFTLQQIKKSG